MPINKTTNPNVIKYINVNQGVTLAGIVFLIIGLTAFCKSIGLTNLKLELNINNFEQFYASIATILISLVMVLFRITLEINLQKRTIIRSYGTFTKIKRREYNLDDYQNVALSKEERRKRRGGYYSVFALKLTGKGNANSLNLEDFMLYEPAKKNAETLSTFLGFPILVTTQEFKSRIQKKTDTQKHTEPQRDTEVENLITRRKKIEAVQLYREKYGVDLKNAREMIESLAKKLGLRI